MASSKTKENGKIPKEHSKPSKTVPKTSSTSPDLVKKHHKHHHEKMIVKRIVQGKIVSKPQKVSERTDKQKKEYEDFVVNSYLHERALKQKIIDKDLKNREKMKKVSENVKLRKAEKEKAAQELKAKIEQYKTAEKPEFVKNKIARREEEAKKKEEKRVAAKKLREEKRAKIKAKKIARKEKLAKKGENKEDDKKLKGKKQLGIRKVYQAQPRPKKVTRPKPKCCKLRSSIHPGQVLIVLRGPHRGKRVVFLRQLTSGLLMVTGPYCLNKVPLRRLDQRYVIATSTRLDISKFKIDPRFNDKYFRRPFKMRRLRRRTLEVFFRKRAVRKYAKRKSYYHAIRQHINNRKWVFPRSVSKTKKIDQKKLDRKMMTAIRNVPLMRRYLRTPFTLSNGQYPHAMKF